MKLKKGWKRFWTLNRHHADGFTLVELIVVIAILAILAGVGSVGYSGYIKSARKKADQTLVANIIRAVETGTNTTMFTPPESLAVSATTYPVGFITLTSEGGKTLTSNTTGKNLDDPCELVYDIEVLQVQSEPLTLTCNKKSDHTTTVTKYTGVTTKTISYCKTHSNIDVKTLTAPDTSSYPDGYSDYIKGTGINNYHTHTGGEANHWLTVGEGATPDNPVYITANPDDIYKPVAGGDICEFATYSGREDFVADTSIATDSGVLHDSINAAFGDGANLALQYDKWGEEDEIGYTTLYTSANQMFTQVDEVATLLVKLQKVPLVGSKLDSYLTADYDNNSGELVISFADFMTEKFSGEEGSKKWEEAWAGAATCPHDEYTFNLNAKNDYTWAARMSYNTSFASYCAARGVEEKYTQVISDYGEVLSGELAEKVNMSQNLISTALDVVGGDTNIPSVVNTYAFDTTKSTLLKEQFEAAGDDGTVFEECKDLYKTYKDSDACKKNGQEFLNTMVTISDTGDYAMDEDNAFGGNYLDYYKSYLDEMAGLYEKAAEESKNGIMIIVTMNNGVLECSVSPASADLRNE